MSIMLDIMWVLEFCVHQVNIDVFLKMRAVAA